MNPSKPTRCNFARWTHHPIPGFMGSRESASLSDGSRKRDHGNRRVITGTVGSGNRRVRLGSWSLASEKQDLRNAQDAAGFLIAEFQFERDGQVLGKPERQRRQWLAEGQGMPPGLK
jgi:hypothetical protein